MKDDLRARPEQRYTYLGYALIVTDALGRVTGKGLEGFYVENTRLLSKLEFTVDGQALVPFAASAVDRHGLLAYAQVPSSPLVPADSVYAALRIGLEDDALRVIVAVHNWSLDQPATFEVALAVAADFADIEAVETGELDGGHDVGATWDEAGRCLVLRSGHPTLAHATEVRVESAPGDLAWREADGALVAAFAVGARQAATLELLVTPVLDGFAPDERSRPLRDRVTSLARLQQELHDEAPRLISSNATVSRAWQAAVDDLASLPLGLRSGPATPVAGLPIFQQLFGRDSLTIAGQAAMVMPTMLRDTLLTNAAWQGREIDHWRDEEPGRILHQARRGPRSLLGTDPFDRYYGDHTAPADFLMMLGLYALWTGDLPTVRRLLPAARSVLAWKTNFGDADGDGFLEYQSRSANGVKQQGWKDSDDAIVDVDGTVIEPPIATSVVQGYWFAGLRLASVAFWVAGRRAEALGLLRDARRFQRRFHERFWMDDEQFYAMALGPDGRLVRSISSNPGHLLAAGIVPKAMGPVVARRLMEPDLFSGWGIRTLSGDHRYYNPFSYHRGSLWPVENGTFAFGMARYGCLDELHRLAEALFASTELFAGNRLPEVMGGLANSADHPHPGVYPGSNQPQGWSASAVVLTVQALLGMEAIAPRGLLVLDPHLPAWLPDLAITGLRVGSAVVDLDFRRTKRGATSWRVTRREGRLMVVSQPPPQSAAVSVRQRLLAGLASVPRGLR